MTEIAPSLDAFREAYAQGRPQVVWTTLVADLETPVSAFLKLTHNRSHCFLLESVEGGTIRGRYSIIGLMPDVIWRCRGNAPEINRQALYDLETFEADSRGSLDSMRALLDESLIDLPEDPMDPAANGALAQQYLGDIVNEPCVFQLPSGLIFRVRTAVEDAASPMRGDMVTVNYRGQLLDGEEFDSSWTRGEPATFPSDRLIAGWVEALPLMQVGERWELFIHPDLAYGMRGTPGGPIGPNMALVFELELLDLPG